MARPLRVFDPAAYYHVAARGNDGRRIFFDDSDRQAFLLMLERTWRKNGWAIVAYCLMDNHVHLVLQAPAETLSRGMQQLLSGYSVRTNKRYGRTGHLFRYRFLALLIETDAHLLEVCRYVVLNPVRAGRCMHPADWSWGSYRASAGLEHAPRFLSLTELLSLFGRNPSSARRAYRQHVSEGHVPVSDARPAGPGGARGVRLP